jgi:hypothetical protein
MKLPTFQAPEIEEARTKFAALIGDAEALAASSAERIKEIEAELKALEAEKVRTGYMCERRADDPWNFSLVTLVGKFVPVACTNSSKRFLTFASLCWHMQARIQTATVDDELAADPALREEIDREAAAAHYMPG